MYTGIPENYILINARFNNRNPLFVRSLKTDLSPGFRLPLSAAYLTQLCDFHTHERLIYKADLSHLPVK